MSPFRVGLTGGIGSGKSAVAERFAALGAAVVDTDAIAHELTAARGEAMPAIQAEFGDAVIAADGAMDRAAMRRKVFADADARRRLEAILHPLIRAESERRVAAASAPYVVLVVPLLVESGDFRSRVDRVLVVDCSEETQRRRVAARGGLTATDIVNIMAAQATRAARRAAADDVIDNEGNLVQLAVQTAKFDTLYRGLSAKTGPDA